MGKYHVSSNGELAECKARKVDCPLEHFESDSKAGAQKDFEAVMSERHGETNTIRSVSKEETEARNKLSEMLEKDEITMPDGNPESSSWSIADTFQKSRYNLAKQVAETGEARMVVAAPGEPGDGEEWTDEEYKDMQEKYKDDPDYEFTEENVVQILNAQQVLARMPKSTSAVPVEKAERKIPLRMKGYYSLSDNLELVEDRRAIVSSAKKVLKDPLNSFQSTQIHGVQTLPADFQRMMEWDVESLGEGAHHDDIRQTQIEAIEGYERMLGEDASRIGDSMDRTWSRLKESDVEAFREGKSPKQEISGEAKAAFREDKTIFKDKKSASKDEIFKRSNLSEQDFNDSWSKLVEDSKNKNIPPTFASSASVVEEFHLEYTDEGVNRK